jgi:hypothetical protein
MLSHGFTRINPDRPFLGFFLVFGLIRVNPCKSVARSCLCFSPCLRVSVVQRFSLY